MMSQAVIVITTKYAKLIQETAEPLPDGDGSWQNADKHQVREGIGLNRYKYTEITFNRFQCADKHFILSQTLQSLDFIVITKIIF